MTFYSLIGALVFLVIGMIELTILYRVLYPRLRWSYEQAKTTQTQGIDPNRIMMFFKIQSLVAMPVIGLFFGDSMREIFG